MKEKLSDLWYGYGWIFKFLGGLISFICFLFGLIYTGNYINCSRFQKLDTIHEYHADLFLGCRVKLNSGFWIDPDKVNANDLYLRGEK